MGGESYMTKNEDILQEVTGSKSQEKNNIFLACDNIFYHRFAINFAKTIRYYAPYLHIHIHVVNHTGELFKDKKITYTFEKLPTLPELPSTRFYASVRLLRAEELFDNDQRVMIVDVDSLVTKPIPESEYIEQSSKLSQLVRKGGRWNNSMICLGLGETSANFKKSIKEALLEIPIPQWDGWYDQDAMDKIRHINTIEPISLSWLNFSYKKGLSYFYSGKGTRKDNVLFTEITNNVLKGISS